MYHVFERKSLAEIHREAIANSLNCLGRDVHRVEDCALCNGELLKEFGGPFSGSAVYPAKPRSAVILHPAPRVKQVRTVFAKSELLLRSQYPDISGPYEIHAGLWSGTIKR